MEFFSPKKAMPYFARYVITMKAEIVCRFMQIYWQISEYITIIGAN